MKRFWLKYRLALVMATWALAIVSSLAAGVHHALGGDWTAAAANAGAIVGISVLDLLIVRPKIMQERRVQRAEEAATRKKRVAELEKELGIG